MLGEWTQERINGYQRDVLHSAILQPLDHHIHAVFDCLCATKLCYDLVARHAGVLLHAADGDEINNAVTGRDLVGAHIAKQLRWVRVACRSILDASQCLCSVSYTHLTLPTNRE